MMTSNIALLSAMVIGSWLIVLTPFMLLFYP
jgi:hypothetical protein